MLTGIQFALKMSFDFTVAVQTHESPGKDENGFSGRTHVIVNLLCWLQLVGDGYGPPSGGHTQNCVRFSTPSRIALAESTQETVALPRLLMLSTHFFCLEQETL